MFWVYILQNPKGQFYTGHTNHLAKRVADHNRSDGLHRLLREIETDDEKLSLFHC
jgi:predicted GIY-YIG superfamily endonuclease